MVQKDDPIRILIRTILSQNTSDVQAKKAYENIKGFKAEELRKLEDLEERIRPAGLVKQKARTIREVSKRANEIRSRLRLPDEELRKRLLSIKGIGPKTADLLLIHLGRRAFPIDTHIKRVASRLGRGKSYDEIRRFVMERIEDPKDLHELHLALISLGRAYCRPKPRCNECPLRDICPKHISPKGRRASMKLLAMVLVLSLLLPHAAPTIAVSLSVDKNVIYVGDEITLRLNVTNTWNETVYNVTVYRRVPSGFEISSNGSRVPFIESLKPNESQVLELKLVAKKAGEFPIEPAVVEFATEDGKKYVAYSNRLFVKVYDQEQKSLEEAESRVVKYSAIAAALSALGLLIALIVRRPRKPRE